jgi:hypothetical protein
MIWAGRLVWPESSRDWCIGLGVDGYIAGYFVVRIGLGRATKMMRYVHT